MPHYLLQVSYTPEGWAALIKSPQNRAEAVRPAIEKVGGKLTASYLTFGKYDVLVLAELPDNASAAGIAIAFAAGGTLKAIKTTPLMTWDEGVEAMRKAGQAGYRPATS